jgi:serine/threonine protein phosphatase PrpC
VKLRWRAAGATDVGRVRPRNEDALMVDEARGIFLVADGMGGHAAGEIASGLAAEVVGGALADGMDRALDADDLADAMVDAIRAADRAILAHSAADRSTEGMGTTVTACVLCPDGSYRLGHVGDSRAYLMRGGRLAQVTRDHTWVQREVDAGRLTPAGARRHHLSHILTRALGVEPAEPPDLMAGALLPGDLLLLATDGLTGFVTDRRLAAILAEPAPLEERVARMIRAANRRGGRDNITAVLVEIEGADDGA